MSAYPFRASKRILRRASRSAGGWPSTTATFEMFGLHEIVSFTVPANLRSRAVMEKIGMDRDPQEDFDHPTIPDNHPLRPHVLYRKARPPVL